jgi:hypothetical protein
VRSHFFCTEPFCTVFADGNGDSMGAAKVAVCPSNQTATSILEADLSQIKVVRGRVLVVHPPERSRVALQLRAAGLDKGSSSGRTEC